MTRRQSPLPRQWLVTDERLGADLWRASGRMPRGGGILVRHHSLGPGQRLHLTRRMARLARRRQLALAVAGDERLARRVGARLVHNPRGRRSALGRSFAVHDVRELRRARLRGAAVLFLSPLHATRSHAGARPLGRMRAATLVRLAGAVPVYALGGMNARRFAALRPLGFAGWAGIDAWLESRI